MNDDTDNNDGYFVINFLLYELFFNANASSLHERFCNGKCMYQNCKFPNKLLYLLLKWKIPFSFIDECK